jgi:hypothetical protein
MLSESYTQKPGSIPEYFQAMLDAQPPDRYSVKFLENLGFKSTNDRLFIGILKDLGFLNRDGAAQQRYFEFLDRTKSRAVVAAGVKDAFSDLFALNIRANDMSVDDVKNKLRTLFAGKKTELTIDRIAKTFKALADYGDFVAAEEISKPTAPNLPTTPLANSDDDEEIQEQPITQNGRPALGQNGRPALGQIEGLLWAR